MRAKLEDHLSSLNHFSGFCAARSDDARGIRHQLGVAEIVLGDLELGLSVIDLSLRRTHRLEGRIVIGPGGEALPEQPVLPIESVAGLD